jgi:hypothetical protein
MPVAVLTYNPSTIAKTKIVSQWACWLHEMDFVLVEFHAHVFPWLICIYCDALNTICQIYLHHVKYLHGTNQKTSRATAIACRR